MKPKRKLKKWVQVVLMLIPEAVIIGQLFLICTKLDDLQNAIQENHEVTIVYKWRCNHE